MHRDFESMAWAEGHHHLSSALTRLIKGLAYAFRRLNEIEYEAPWRKTRR
jgi:hypothetical protein